MNKWCHWSSNPSVSIVLYGLSKSCRRLSETFWFGLQSPFHLYLLPCTEPQKNSPLCVVWLLGPAFVLWSPDKKLWFFLRFSQALTPSSNPSALEDVKSQITSNCPSSCLAFHALFCKVSSSTALSRKKFQCCPLWPYGEISLAVKSVC